MNQLLRPQGILAVTRTINRVVVVEKQPQPNNEPGCLQGGCGCLILLALLLLVLGGINACTDGELWSFNGSSETNAVAIASVASDA